MTMAAKDSVQRCALVVVADGFEETDEIVILGLLREAGVYVKSVGLTSGLIGSVHGVWVMPDLTLTDLDRSPGAMAISAVILPGGRQGLARLENDPRVHRLLQRVVAQRGRIVVGRVGLLFLLAGGVWAGGRGEGDGGREVQVLLRRPGESLEAFARDLARMLRQLPRA